MTGNDKDKIFRLLSYKNLLFRFKSLGFNKVFSDNIADALDISSSLVRKDFSAFGISGNQKGGYKIETVLGRIHEIIGYNEVQKVIIIGVGRIGEALMQYKGFNKDGIQIIAGFDIDGKKINEEAEIPIFHLDRIKDIISKENIKIAILAVPELVAQQVVEVLQQAGIEGILNFTPVNLKSSNDLIINNVNIEHELANLLYFVNHYKKT
jgi:redox-sensing transcriptional repressor